MIKEENLNHVLKRNLHKTSLLILKLIPIVLCILSFLSTILDSFNINIIIINYIMFFIIYLFLYLASYMFSFCEYHRLFLHYIILINIIKIYDCYIGIPIDNFNILKVYVIITVIFIFIISYSYVKSNKKSINKNNK